MSDLELPVARPIAREPTHPGELMREILDEHVKLPIAEAARRMEVSRPALYAVLNGTGALTPEMALRFGRLVHAAPDLYVQMQARRDLWLAEQRLKDALDTIEPGVLTMARKGPETHHVVPNPGGGWDVKRGGAARASGHYETKQAAVKAGREVSGNQGTELRIHNKDGKIGSSDSHGGDPFPPKG